MNNKDKIKYRLLTTFSILFGLTLFFFSVNDYNDKTGLGSAALKDRFSVTEFSIFEIDEQYSDSGQVLGETTIPDHLTFKGVEVDYPLTPEDYYYGKYENGKAGADEINKVPVLRPGDRVRLIRDGYITLYRGNGYVMPGKGYYYGSGLCWSISVVGGMMDDANSEFQTKWGIPLFVFQPGDKAGHGKTYSTYEASNNAHGYSVIKLRYGGGQDYSFTVNPEIENIPELKDLELKLVMTSTDVHETASYGQSIGGHILTNKDVFLSTEIEIEEEFTIEESEDTWFGSILRSVFK